MNHLPGFTAEAVFTERRATYRVATGSDLSHGRGELIPQLTTLTWIPKSYADWQLLKALMGGPGTWCNYESYLCGLKCIPITNWPPGWDYGKCMNCCSTAYVECLGTGTYKTKAGGCLVP
jgi:hypothetical protein